MLVIIFVVLSSLVTTDLVEGRLKDYSGYKRFTIEYSNDDVYQHMIEMREMIDKLDFWQLTRNQSIIMVPPRFQRVFQQRMNTIGAQYEIQSEGSDETYDCEYLCPQKRSNREPYGFFRKFHRYDIIMAFMENMAFRHPNLVRFSANGRTVEGRRIGMLSISLSRGITNKLIYFQGGSHAREWISPSTLLYFAAELVNNFGQYAALLNNTEIVIVPVLNPDGYELTHTYNRLWRKNKQRNPNTSCRGVDLNRNFGFYWNVSGTSPHPCSDVYAGTRPFSEPETQLVQNFLERNRNRTKLVVDVHAFGSYLFYPWGYKSGDAPTKNFLHSVAERVAEAIYNYRGTAYTVGSSAEVLYEAAGGLDDYSYGQMKVPLAYTMELPGDDFDVDPNEIVPVGKETFAGFIEFLKVVSSF